MYRIHSLWKCASLSSILLSAAENLIYIKRMIKWNMRLHVCTKSNHKLWQTSSDWTNKERNLISYTTINSFNGIRVNNASKLLSSMWMVRHIHFLLVTFVLSAVHLIHLATACYILYKVAHCTYPLHWCLGEGTMNEPLKVKKVTQLLRPLIIKASPFIRFCVSKVHNFLWTVVKVFRVDCYLR